MADTASKWGARAAHKVLPFEGKRLHIFAAFVDYRIAIDAPWLPPSGAMAPRVTFRIGEVSRPADRSSGHGRGDRPGGPHRKAMHAKHLEMSPCGRHECQGIVQKNLEPPRPGFVL
jgi:hypothetical protein